MRSKAKDLRYEFGVDRDGQAREPCAAQRLHGYARGLEQLVEESQTRRRVPPGGVVGDEHGRILRPSALSIEQAALERPPRDRIERHWERPALQANSLSGVDVIDAQYRSLETEAPCSNAIKPTKASLGLTSASTRRL